MDKPLLQQHISFAELLLSTAAGFLIAGASCVVQCDTHKSLHQLKPVLEVSNALIHV